MKKVINRSDFIQKVSIVRLHRFDHELPLEKLSLIINYDFNQLHQLHCDQVNQFEIELDVLEKLSQYFLVSPSYFLNEETYQCKVPEFYHFRNSRNEITTSDVSEKELTVTLPSTIFPHELFYIPTNELYGWILHDYMGTSVHEKDRLNCILFYIEMKEPKSKIKANGVFQLHYNPVRNRFFVSFYNYNAITWFSFCMDKPISYEDLKDMHNMTTIATSVTYTCTGEIKR